MKFHPSYAGTLAALCSNEQSLYNISWPNLDVTRKVLIATNGHALVVIPVTPEDGETSGPIDLRALKPYQAAMKAWRKASLHFSKAKRPTEPTLHCGENIVFTAADGCVMTFPRATDTKYPDWNAVLPEYKGRTVHLNPEKLRDLYKALCQEHQRAAGITLWIPDDVTKGVGVSLLSRPTAGLGVLMPMRGEGFAPSLDKLDR